jgi:hypothetical protein
MATPMTKWMKPSDRFKQEIEPALADYKSDPLSERKANVLASAIDHYVDWTYVYLRDTHPSRVGGAKNEKQFLRQLLPQCPQLQIMNELCDAYHHRELDQPSNPPRLIKESTAAYSVQDGALHVQRWNKPFLSEVTTAVDFLRNLKD